MDVNFRTGMLLNFVAVIISYIIYIKLYDFEEKKLYNYHLLSTLFTYFSMPIALIIIDILILLGSREITYAYLCLGVGLIPIGFMLKYKKVITLNSSLKNARSEIILKAISNKIPEVKKESIIIIYDYINNCVRVIIEDDRILLKNETRNLIENEISRLTDLGTELYMAKENSIIKIKNV